VSNIKALGGVFFVLRIPNNYNTSNGDLTALPPSASLRLLNPSQHQNKFWYCSALWSSWFYQ